MNLFWRFSWKKYHKNGKICLLGKYNFTHLHSFPSLFQALLFKKWLNQAIFFNSSQFTYAITCLWRHEHFLNFVFDVSDKKPLIYNFLFALQIHRLQPPSSLNVFNRIIWLCLTLLKYQTFLISTILPSFPMKYPIFWPNSI